MKRFCLAALAAMVVGAWLALPAAAQKGRGGKGSGRGGFSPPAKSSGSVLPSAPGKSQPARPFAHPKSGNSLPQEVRDRLPPGLRDKPENHPGLANHLRKMGYKPATAPTPPATSNPNLPVRETPPPPLADEPTPPVNDSPTPPAVTNPTPPVTNNPTPPVTNNPPPVTNNPTPVPQPTRGNSLPQEVRDRLPPGLRDQAEDHPGLLNHLRRMGWTVGEDGSLVPPPARPAPLAPFRPFGGLFRRR
jgi:hypothetical protein